MKFSFKKWRICLLHDGRFISYENACNLLFWLVRLLRTATTKNFKYELHFACGASLTCVARVFLVSNLTTRQTVNGQERIRTKLNQFRPKNYFVVIFLFLGSLLNGSPSLFKIYTQHLSPKIKNVKHLH